MIFPCTLTVWNIGGSIKKSDIAIMGIIIAVALTVRFIGIGHGFPFIYHSDEPAVIRSALSIRFDLNPHHFDWPHLYFYVNYLVFMVFARFRDVIASMGIKPLITQTAPVIYNDNLIFYLLSRILSATLGALTVIPLYLWIKKLVSKKAGILASIFFALAPFHVRHSHYALIDVPMLFFLCWSLFFSTFSPILAGLFLGFSASAKYNGLLGGVFITAFYLLRKTKPLTKRVVDILNLGLFTIVGFLIGTPYALLDYKTFLRTDGPQGALWQFTNVGKVGLIHHIEQFSNTLIIKLPNDLGYGAAALFVVASIILIQGIITKKAWRKIIGFSVITFLALTYYVSGLLRNPSHYYMIVYPYFFMTIGYSASLVLDKIKPPLYKIAFLILVLVPSLLLSVQNINDLKNKRSDKIYGGDIIKDVKINP